MSDPSDAQQFVTILDDPHRYVTPDGEVHEWERDIVRHITVDGVSGRVWLMREVSSTPFLADPNTHFGPGRNYQGYLCWYGSFVSDDQKHRTGLGAYADLPSDEQLVKDLRWQFSPAKVRE